MFDHVTIGTADRDASERFYRTVLSALGYGEPSGGDAFVEWDDFSLAQAGATRPVTNGVHIAFVAPRREAMEAFWRAGVEAGYCDDGAPGPRLEYGPDYEGAFLLDPDGNSAEATFHGDRRLGRRIDHLWIRVADRAASRRFYTTVVEAVGFGEAEQLADRTRYARDRDGGTFSIVDGPATGPFHLAFGVADRSTVEDFHRAATRAGFTDNGGPAERPEYHPGYFGSLRARSRTATTSRRSTTDDEPRTAVSRLGRSPRGARSRCWRSP